MALCVFLKGDFLDLWRRALPKHYTEPIENEGDGEGFDVPSSQAAVWEEFERSLNLNQQAYFLRPHSTQSGPIARSGAKATGTIELRRVAPALGSIVIPPGQRLIAETTDSFGGVLGLGRVLLVDGVTLPEGTGGPVVVDVEAEFQGYSGNLVPGMVVRFEEQGRLSVPAVVLSTNQLERNAVTVAEARADSFNDSLMGRYLRLVPGAVPLVTFDALVPRRITSVIGQVVTFEPVLDAADIGKKVTVEIEELADLGVQVSQPLPITGGVGDALSAIAVDRRQGKAGDETDDQFADRLVELPDVVSPNAIERKVDRILSPLGIGFCIRETRDIDGLMGFTWDLHPWDFGEACGCGLVKPIGSELVGEGQVWIDTPRHVRFFIVCVERVPISDSGSAWDFGAFDNFFWDGSDFGYSSVLGNVWHEVNQARAAGVAFLLVQDPSL